MIKSIESLLSIACDAITDRIATQSISLRTARIAYRIARMIDPHAAYHAAHIRDAIRDNY